MRPIVFLDLDDVLCLNNPYTGYDARALVRAKRGDPDARAVEYVDLWDRLFHRQVRANLQALDAEFVPWYVVSSSWRTSFTRKEMEIVFRQGGVGFVADALHEIWQTPNRTRGYYGGIRREEIEEWIAKWHDNVSPWVAIDDHESGESLIGHDNAVLCFPGVGFDGDKLQEARGVLRMPGA